MNRFPKAKLENIVVQDLKGELLVYNLTTHKAYTLNETSKIVFNACDGQTSFDDLKRRHKFTDDLIHLALGELNSNDLLRNYQSDHFAGLSRREVVKRVGLSSLIALPVIAGITAPIAAHAQSIVRCPTGQILNSSGVCVSICQSNQTFNAATGTCVCNDSTSTNCGGTCVDTSNDRNNCGACGNTCAAGQSCSAGACRQNPVLACRTSADCPTGSSCNVLGVCTPPLDF